MRYSIMNYLKMRAEAAIPASSTVDEIACRACGSSSGAAAAYCSTCGAPLGLDRDASFLPVGTRMLSRERLLAGYVIPGVLLTFLSWLLLPFGILLLPGPIGLGLALSADGRLKEGDIEGADNNAWKARIALALGGVILGLRLLAPVAARVLNFLTSL
jgi:hypothetical protein